MPANHRNPEYQLGVQEVDTQHSDLIRLIDELHEAVTAGAGMEAVTRIVGRVVADTREHIEAEEHLMDQHGFPGRGNHHIEHVTLIKKAEQLRRQVRAGKLDRLVESHADLSKWLKRHISSADKELALFLHGKGVT